MCGSTYEETHFCDSSNQFRVFGCSEGSTEATTLEASKNPMRYLLKVHIMLVRRAMLKTISYSIASFSKRETLFSLFSLKLISLICSHGLPGDKCKRHQGLLDLWATFLVFSGEVCVSLSNSETFEQSSLIYHN